MAKKRTGSKRPKKASQRLSLKAAALLSILAALWGTAGVWFVHHPRAWINDFEARAPAFLAQALYASGNPLGDITDSLGLTGHDVVYDYDTEAPRGEVLFAGAPVRTGAPAPDDVVTVDRGTFLIGWSPSLRHPLWCAYHVTAEAHYEDGKRPSFSKDSALATAHPNDYKGSGYDRGHLVPNHAIVTRYGPVEQKKTFSMANIAPQLPALNRGVWRDFEHRIADLWTARYGEIWVIVGCIPSATGHRLPGSQIDVPRAYYQLVVAQEGMDVRALAVILPAKAGWSAWAARHIVSIDELERATGLDFLPDLPAFIQDPLEAETPTRLWPVRPLDIIRQLVIRYEH